MGSVSNPPWTERRVLTYAHQGGAWESPSSTLFAIRRALEAGVTGIELDVHATADRKLIVCHDRTVDRTTNGTGQVSSLTLGELRELDNAYWFIPGADVTPGMEPDQYPYRGRGPQDREFAIATLAEVLDLLSGYPDVALNLDIKSTSPTYEPYETLLADELREHSRVDGVIIASFIDSATRAFSDYAPEFATSAGTQEISEFVRAVRAGDTPPDMRHVALQIPASYAGVTLLDEQLLEAAHGAGLAVHVWTIDDEPEMARLIDLGADGVITDIPTTLVKMVGSRNVGWSRR